MSVEGEIWNSSNEHLCYATVCEVVWSLIKMYSEQYFSYLIPLKCPINFDKDKLLKLH